MPDRAELEDDLPGAVLEVSALCVSNHPEGSGPQQPWQTVAERHPRFQERIDDLQVAVTAARRTKVDNPALMTEIYKNPFREAGMEWRRAMDLLSDILIARVSLVPGVTDPRRDPYAEGFAMIGEMGVEPGSAEAHRIQIEDVVRAVLDGRLSVAP